MQPSVEVPKLPSDFRLQSTLRSLHNDATPWGTLNAEFASSTTTTPRGQPYPAFKEHVACKSRYRRFRIPSGIGGHWWCRHLCDDVHPVGIGHQATHVVNVSVGMQGCVDFYHLQVNLPPLRRLQPESEAAVSAGSSRTTPPPWSTTTTDASTTATDMALTTIVCIDNARDDI